MSKYCFHTTLISLAILSGTSLVPAVAQSEPLTQISGSWNLMFDWSCNNSPAPVTINFYKNGTFRTADGSAGVWSFVGETIAFKFNNDTTYTGIAYNGTMKGRSTTYNNLGSIRGCWTATKPTVQSFQRQQMPQYTPDGELIKR